MIDLVAIAEQAQRGDLRCTECGVNVVLIDPFTDRHFLADTSLYQDQEGKVYARCAAHNGSSAT